MAFEMATFTGTIRDSGRFLVERRHEFDYQDGCHWVGRDVIEGAMPSLDGFTGEHRYEEWPKRGEQCARACLDITSRLSGSRGIR